MGIQLTADKVLALAPDASSASAGKKLGRPQLWKEVGQSPEALWGKCQGSALYTVRINLVSYKIDCSCPSRKHPCKHGLGLLLMACTLPDAVPTSEQPEWVTSWLAKQQNAIKAQELREEQKALGPTLPTPPSPAQIKRIEKRMALVMRGIEQLDLWLEDIVRNGLAQIATKSNTFWESQAAQMVDAQAPGLAARLRRMADIPNSSPDWPERLLAQLGQLALLTHAFRTLPQLDPALQEDIRQLIGWNVESDEVIARGERVSDEWMVVGQRLEEGERVITQYNWLLGCTTGRPALVLQYSPGKNDFKESFIVGTSQRVELIYWPGAVPQRAMVATRQGIMMSLEKEPVGFATVEAFLDDVAHRLTRQPWQERFLCPLQDVVPFFSDNQWYVRDSVGYGLPLVEDDSAYWNFLALSGGRPLTLFGEWDGEAVLPLGIFVNKHYYAAWRSL